MIVLAMVTYALPNLTGRRLYDAPSAAIASTKRDLPQPVGPLRSTGSRRAWAWRKTSTS